MIRQWWLPGLAAVLVSCGSGTEPSGTIDPIIDSLLLENFGVAPVPVGVPLTSTGGRVSWSATSNATWLTLSPVSGNTPGSLSVSANAGGFQGGAAFAVITISSNGGNLQLPVRMQVPKTDGSWGGVVGVANFSLNLTENSGFISGTGTASRPGGSDPIVMDGTHDDHPEVVLTFTIPGFQPFAFFGTFTSGNTLVGSLNGSGFTGEQLTLTR